MNKILAGLLFFLMATIFYSTNVIATTIVKVNGGVQSDVGYLLIVLSIVTFVIGMILLLMGEREGKYNVEKTKEEKKSF
ncbi:MAG: hypothetical protein ACI35O_07725 [Bacillaceae bacterium]